MALQSMYAPSGSGDPASHLLNRILSKEGGLGTARAAGSGGGSSSSNQNTYWGPPQHDTWDRSYYNPNSTRLREHPAWHKPDASNRRLETKLKGQGLHMQEQIIYEHFQPYLFPQNQQNQQQLADIKAAQNKLLSDQQKLSESQSKLTKDQKRFGEERALWDAQFKTDDQGITYIDVGDPSTGQAGTSSNVAWNLPDAPPNRTVGGVKTHGVDRRTRSSSTYGTFNRRGDMRIRNNQLNV